MRTATTATDRPGSGRTWRVPLVAVLVFLSVLSAPLTVVAQHVNREITDTDAYLETVGPLAENPVVQEAISRRVTDEILGYLRIDDLTDEALTALADRSLPPLAIDALRAISVPLGDAVVTYIRDTVSRTVRSEQFAAAWVEANRVAHTHLVAVVTGDGTDKIEVAEGTVSVDLAAVIATVKQVLLDSGFERAVRIPEVSAQFVIFDSADLVKIQRLTRALDRTAAALPVIGLLLLVAALALARRRRRVVIVASLGVAATMVLMGVGLAWARSAYLDAVPIRPEGIDAATEIFDTVVHLLREQVRAVLLGSLAVAAAAWWSRPGGWLRSLWSWVRAGAPAGRASAFARAHLGALRIAVLAAVALWYVVADMPSVPQTAGALGGAAAAWGTVELLARRAPQVATVSPGRAS